MPGDDKTEKPTAKRLKDERKKGNVFQSKEIITLVSLFAVIFTIRLLGNIILTALLTSFHRFWGLAGDLEHLTASELPKLFIQGAGTYAFAAVPPLLVTGLVTIIATVAQTRGNISFEALKPKFGKMFNPAQSFKKFFSLRAIVELLKSILKIVVLAYVIFGVYERRFAELPRLMEMDFVAMLYYAADFFMDIITSVSVIFIFLAAADYLYQRFQYEKDLRMSKQEIKEEYKQTEGDPQIKGKIKQKQREMAQSRMMSAVPEADVIIRNPTHYAVALQYKENEGKAPMVLAKGADLMALRIIKLAEENGIMLVENKPLARSLYDNVPLEMEIPPDFYGPVAEVLAFVYSMEGRTVAGMGGQAKTPH